VGLNSLLGRIFAGAAGGFAGGALVGVVEGGVIAAGGGAAEYWVFFFAACSYGLLGAAMGGGWGLLCAVLPLPALKQSTQAVAAGLVTASLGLVVSKFRITRDLFAENLPLASSSGIAVHLGLLVGALLLFLLLRAVVQRRVQDKGDALTAARTCGGLVAAALLLGVVVTFYAGGEGGDDVADVGSATGPNVLLIIADTLRADHVGAYGAGLATTPSLDALAADGVVFKNATAQSSWTRPSIATILTSMYPASHQVMHKTDLLPPEVTTLAEHLGDNGYATGGFVTNINVAPSFSFEQGFDVYRYLAPNFFFGATDSGSKLALYGGMRLVRERFLSGSKQVDHYYQDGTTVNGASLPWLDQADEGAFFALVHYMDPHDPYFELPYNGRAVARVETPHPDPSRAGELRDLYRSNVEYLDVFVGQLIDALKKAGVYDDTLIVFTADHGEEFYEHGGWWHGTTLYEEQLRVPLIIKLPGAARAGSSDDGLARLLDIAPTVAAGAGLSAAGGWQGRDLFGDSKAPTGVYAEEDHEGNVLESIRGARWKLIVANEGNPRGLEPVELYDLLADPGETDNLAGKQQAVVAGMLSDLEVLRTVAAAAAVQGSEGELDDASRERLRALGYME
jgi:arylsulfatase A-like enzyme